MATVKPSLKYYGFKSLLTMLGFGSLLSLNACTSITNHPYDPNDPLQTVNRATFAFNQQFDRFLLKPTAVVYKTITPAPARQGVNNFFMNLGELPTTANYLLQARPGEAYESFWRFLINSTVGIGGLFDVATHMNFVRTTNDFGITLSKWGFSTSPYFVIPFTGPSNIRDGIGLGVDYELFTVWPYMQDVLLRNSLLALDMVRVRANLLDTENILNEAAMDKYTLTRDAYVQYRYQLITAHGGEYTEGASYEISADELEKELDLDNTHLYVSADTVAVVPQASKGDKAIRTNAINASAEKVVSTNLKKVNTTPKAETPKVETQKAPTAKTQTSTQKAQ